MKNLFILLFASITLNVFAQKENGQSFYIAGNNKLENGNIEGAIAEFDQAIKLDPKNVKYIDKRAYCRVQIEDYKGAIEDYNLVIDENSNNAPAHISRGTAKKKLKDFSGAIEDYNKALAIDPKNTEALINRGFVKKSLKDEDGACNDWNAAKKLGTLIGTSATLYRCFKKVWK